MANTIKLKRASGSDPSASDLSVGELAIRTSNCKLFSKNDGGSAVGIVAGSADTLTTARTIAGVSFDGSANISLNNNAITNGAGYLADIVSDTSPQLGGDLQSNGNDIDFADNDKAIFGTGQDLEIFHDTTHSYIDNKNGNLRIRNNGTVKTAQFEVDTIDFNDSANTEVRVRINGNDLSLIGVDLDVQSNKITTATSNGNVKIEPNGTGVVEVRGAGGNDGKLQLNCSAQSHGIKLASPAHSAGQSYTLIFPDNQIAADKYLKIKSISGSGSTAIGQAEYASLDANDLGEGTVPDARFPSTLPALNGSALTDLNGSNISSGTIAAARVATLNQDTTGSSASCTGNAATATALANARTIAGVSFDGTSNISLNNNAITNGAGYITSTLTEEQVEDFVGGMVTGNTETGITVTYQDSDGTLDFVVGGLANAQISSSAAIAGTKISPDFGSQNVVTTGSLGSGNITITSATPAIVFSENDANPDFQISNNGGVLRIEDVTNGYVTRFAVNTDGHVDVGGNLDVGGGVDVTGNITVSGTVDGRDVATDGSKLDGIASGATNVTNNNQITNGAGYITGSSLNASNLSSGTIPDARFPSTLPAVDGSNLTGISAGATGGGSDEIFYENGQTVTTNYTITNGKNAMSAGPITINSGVTVTVGSGETLTIV